MSKLLLSESESTIGTEIMRKQTIKRCRDCGLLKPLDEFHKNLETKDKHLGICKTCSRIQSKRYMLHNKAYRPWVWSYYNCRERCNNPKYREYKYYGGKGIKCLMTLEDFRFIYKRDKAYLMVNPTISRRSHKDHYRIDNCLYEESHKHFRNDSLKRSRDKEGKFI